VIRVERRLRQPRWLLVAVPVGSLVVAFGVMTLVLLVTHHPPGHTFRRLFDSGFVGQQSLNASFISATPLLFTGLCAAIAFRMQLFNIGGEGQLYAGAIVGAAAGIAVGNHSGWLSIPAMIAAGAAGGAALALIPAILRAFFSTNEIITSLMLNYVAALVINYLIFDSESYWRDTSSPTAKVFPQGKNLPASASWPVTHVGSLVLPFGLLVGCVVAALIWVLHPHALRLRGAGDRRLTPGGLVCRDAHPPEDPRRDGPLRRGRGHRRRLAGR
jgi:simple sugar transport system permease protein